MLIYDNRERLRILLQVEGGVLYHCLPRSLFIGVCTFVIAFWIRSEDESFWKPHITNTWAAKTFGMSLSFAVVYRTRMAWARYWEAATQVHFMFSKLSDCFTQLMSFISTAEKRLAKAGDRSEAAMELLDKLQTARNNIAHDFSLISALGTHRLTHGDLSRMQRRSDMYSDHGWRCVRKCHMWWSHWNDLIVYKQDLRYHDLEKVFRLPHFRVIDIKSRRTEVKARIQRFETTHSVMMPINLMSSHPSKEQATKADSQKSSSICLTASNVTWSSDLVILGPMTMEEKMTLDDIYEADSMGSQPDRVAMLTGWINEDINELVPLVGIPPPIISRCYQELSNGMLGFNQAMKMADIPFPFPFLQLMELLLVCYSLLLPVYAAQFTGGLFSSPFLATIVSLAFWSLSEISRELETPFADGPNQLPVIDMHERFVEVVRTMFLARRPMCENKRTTGMFASDEAADDHDDKAGEEEESKKGQ